MRIAARCLTFAAAFTLLTSVAHAEDDASTALMGVWKPDDGSTHLVAFNKGGIFEYDYGGAILTLRWELGIFGGQVLIKTYDGKRVAHTCYYKLEGTHLSIDNGSRETCITPGATPPQPMPTAFHR